MHDGEIAARNLITAIQLHSSFAQSAGGFHSAGRFFYMASKTFPFLMVFECAFRTAAMHTIRFGAQI